MNLEETIADLEKQAQQYTQAADALRSLLGQGGNRTTATRQSAAGRKSALKAGAKKKGQRSRKAPVSPETRAKISEALRASHAARKAQPESAA